MLFIQHIHSFFFRSQKTPLLSVSVFLYPLHIDDLYLLRVIVVVVVPPRSVASIFFVVRDDARRRRYVWRRLEHRHLRCAFTAWSLLRPHQDSDLVDGVCLTERAAP